MPPYGVRFSPNRGVVVPPPTVRGYSQCLQKLKRLPPVKGAGATAPEGLFGLDFLPNKREGKPLPYGI